MVRVFWISVSVFCLVTGLNAQQSDSTHAEVQDDLERALEDFDPVDPVTADEQLAEYLQDLAANPINVNTAGVEEMLGIPGMSLRHAKAIIWHRKQKGSFEILDRLLDVKGIGPVTLQKIRPYIITGHRDTSNDEKAGFFSNAFGRGNLEIYSRYRQTLEDQAGYLISPSEGGYYGKPFTYYQRIKYRSDRVSLNITQEKDPGEAFEGTAGFDYSSGHLSIQDMGIVKVLTLGDFGLSFGQGLVLWGGGAFGKGRDVVRSVNRNGRGVSPYSSAQESDAYRGAAVTLGNNMQFTGFYSFRNRTASVIAGDTIRFPQRTGLHRTDNERSRYNNTRQELYGGNIRFVLPAGTIGATGYKTVFNKYIEKGSAAYNRYDFTGVGNYIFSLDVQFLISSLLFFGEAARSRNGGIGYIAGLESDLDEQTGISLAFRNYAKDFQSFQGDGFGESSGDPANEIGVYLGIRHRLNRGVILSAYFDQYRFPSPRFGTHQPTRGHDWLGLAELRINRNLDLYLQLRSEVKEDEFESVDEFGRFFYNLGEALRRSVRLQLEYRVNKKVRIRSRGEFLQNRQPGSGLESGMLVYQDLRLIPSSKWKIDTRVTVFETSGFDTRMYQFENDLLYVMSNEVLFGQGQRLYLLLNYKPFRFMEIWGKYGVTVFENELTIGSGLDEIQGNRRREVGVQVRLRF